MKTIFLFLNSVFSGFLQRLFCPAVAFYLLFSPFLAEAREDSLVPPLPRGGHIFFMELHTGYYYTESNYIKNFKSQNLRQVLGPSSIPNNNVSPFFHYMNMDFSLGYNWIDYFEIEAFSSGFWFAQSGNGQNLTSGFKIQRAGGAVRSQQAIAGVFGLTPEFSFSIPLFSINRQSLQPITDDDSLHFTPSLWMYGIIGEIFYPFVQVGFKWRSPLSSLLNWRAGVMLQGELAELGVSTYGFWSVIRDSSSSVLGDRVNLLKKNNAGSLKFFSANPNVIGFMGWIAWHIPYVTLRLYGDFDINGSQYSKGYSFLASLIIETGSKDKEKVKEIFNEKVDFEPQVTELEKALKEAEQIEESKMEKSPESIESTEEN